MKPIIIRPEVVIEELGRVFSDARFNDGRATLFNSGELSDSLMNPKVMAQIAELL